MATLEELKRGLIEAHKAGNKEHATKLANAIRKVQSVTPRSEAELTKEYESQPWYSKLGTAADDLVRIGASGISFGALDEWLGPEQKKLTEEARRRAGWAGTAADVGGMVASPITRAVGAVGNVASRAAPGLLSRMGIAAGEGATLGATDAAIKGKDVEEAATLGAVISAAIPALGKIMSSSSSFIQGTKPGAISDAFDAGMEGGTISRSFRDGQAGRPINSAKREFAAAEQGWNNTRAVDPRALNQELADITRGVTTQSGVPRLTPTDMRAFENITRIVNRALVRGPNVQNMDAIRRQLDDFASQGETQAMMATRLREQIRQSVNAVEPTYVPSLNRYSRSKDAQAAGRELAGVFPKGSLLGHLAQTAVIGSSVIGAPIIHPAIAAIAPAFSPRASGLIANLFGELAGRTGVRPGAAAPMWSNYQDRKNEKRKERKRKEKPMEINIPGGDL